MNLRRFPFLSVLALHGMGFPLLQAATDDIDLVSGARSAFRIIHAPDAPVSVRKAAQELQSYVEKVTTATLPVNAVDGLVGGPVISLGDTATARAAGLRVDEIPLEGYRITTRNGNVFVLGPDTPEGETTLEGGTSTGTLNGAHTFIEDYLDVRWLLPGPLGEDVPRRLNVAVPAVDRMDKPVFQNRRLVYMQNDQTAVKEWASRHKLGFSLKLEHSHNWQYVVPPEMYVEHPNWFPEVNGKRPPVVGDRYKLETTDQGLIQHYADAAKEAFRKNPKLTVFSLSPTDSSGWSTSAASTALYDRDPHGKLSVTPLVLKFYNDVAKIVGQEYPDRKLAGYVYASYLYPPTSGVPRLEPNLFLVVAPSISYGYQLYRDGVKEDWERIMAGWASQTSQLSYYDLFNHLKGNSGAITPPAPEILNFAFPRLKKIGVRGVYVSGTAEWSQAAVANYALAKMVWNPSLDANAVSDEFYRRAYGPLAAEKMRELVHLVDAAVKAFYNADATANYTATARYMSEVLGANYPRIEALYLEAKNAAQSSSPGQRARLDFFGDNLAFMQLQLRGYGFLPEEKTSPLYRTDADLEPKLGKVNPSFGVAFAPGMLREKKSFAPVRAEWLPALPNPRPITPLALRGESRFMVFPKADQEVRVVATALALRGSFVRCDAYSADGGKVAGGILRLGTPVRFLGSAGQVYYIEVSGGSSGYQLQIEGAPYALAADATNKGVHISGKASPFYFRVPEGVRHFTLTTSSGAPGETSLSHVYGPTGRLVETLDTQTTSVARATVRTSGEPAGFWCLSIDKAPKGGFDDVYVELDRALPQWFTLNPAEPVLIAPLRTIK